MKLLNITGVALVLRRFSQRMARSWVALVFLPLRGWFLAAWRNDPEARAVITELEYQPAGTEHIRVSTESCTKPRFRGGKN